MDVWWERLGLVCILLLALILRTQQLEQISFWFDEACSWKISQFAWPEMWDAISRDAHPPLFYILLKGWMSLFGNSVVSARMLSVTFGVLTVAMSWVFMHVATGSQDGNDSQRFRAAPLMAALFVALSPLQVELSLEARPYALGTFFTLVLATSVLCMFESPSPRWSWLGFAVGSVALSMTHYYGALMVVAIWLPCVPVAISRVRSGPAVGRRYCLGFGTTGLLMLAVWIPWFSTFRFQLARANRQLWFSELDPDGLATILWKSLAGGKHSGIWENWIWGAVAVWSLVAFGLIANWIRSRRLPILLTLSGMLVPALLSIMYSVAVRPILGVKYLIFAQLFLLLGLASLVDFSAAAKRQTKVIVQVAGFVAVLGWSLFWTMDFRVRRRQIAEHPGMRGAMAHLNKCRQKGELCVVASPFVHTLASVYIDDVRNLKTIFVGDYRNSILSGPALRDDDCTTYEDVLDRNPQTLWTIDVDRLFGREFSFAAPMRYQPVSDETFTEEFGYHFELHIRRYEQDATMKSSPRL